MAISYSESYRLFYAGPKQKKLPMPESFFCFVHTEIYNSISQFPAIHATSCAAVV